MKNLNGTGGIYTSMRNGRLYYTGRITIGFDENGKQIQKAFCSYDKDVVIEKLANAQKGIAQGVLKITSSTKFGDYFLSWLKNDKRNEITDGTYTNYYHCYTLRVKGSILEDVPLNKITPLILKDYFNYVEENFKPSILLKTKTIIKTCLSSAVKNEYLAKNPMDSVNIKTKPCKKRECYTMGEQDQIISHLDLDNPIDMLILTAFFTGARLGELQALEWSDINDGIVTINKQLKYITISSATGEKVGKYQIDKVKTSESNREIPIPDRLIKELKAYHLKQKKELLKNGINNNNKVFLLNTGKIINGVTTRDRLKKICQDLNIEYKTFHACRHSYATRLFEVGVNPKVVQKLLGHSNFQTTMDIYTHVSQENKKQAVKLLDKLYVWLQNNYSIILKAKPLKLQTIENEYSKGAY